MVAAATTAATGCDALFGIEELSQTGNADAGLDGAPSGATDAAVGERDQAGGRNGGEQDEGDGGRGSDAAISEASISGATVNDSSDVGVGESASIPTPPSATSFPSCAPGGDGMDNCGGESCCTSLPVSSGTFNRTYSNDDGGEATGLADPATISGFRLDRYLVTVGRFRQYVDYLTSDAGAPPVAGSGKHTHLNGGLGLVNGSSNGAAGAEGYEFGWDPSWNSYIATGPDATSTWNTNLTDDQHCGALSTWTPSPASQENLPINCVNWYEAYAFCIWDGGFLPSEAEAQYAAAGGSQQRKYPWGSADPGTDSQYAIYGDNGGNCWYPILGYLSGCSSAGNLANVGTATLGGGLWGQVDLAGDVYEWALDPYTSTYPDPCVDCVSTVNSTSDTFVTGGSFYTSADSLFVSEPYGWPTSGRQNIVGMRCARPPLPEYGDAGAAAAEAGPPCAADAANGERCAAGEACSIGSCVPASCVPGGAGMSNCAGESCCLSLEVPGGTFERTYTNTGGGAIDSADPATVSGFRLDKYEVTVGRFRQYVNYMTSDVGAPPASGSGTHTHLNGGLGLVNTGSDPEADPSYETGWDPSWNSNIPTGPSSAATWNTNLTTPSICGPFATWTTSPGSQENLPINCLSWYEAYAFCIWDGGFLPSEAEWEYAAAGGNELREYPWGSVDPGRNSAYAIYGDGLGDCWYPTLSSTGAGGCSGPQNLANVGTATLGGGRWGQMDLAGNLYEWELDAYGQPYVDPCVDCVHFPANPSGANFCMGGSFYTVYYPTLSPSTPNQSFSRQSTVGVRCARVP